jgi:hypothetical protein
MAVAPPFDLVIQKVPTAINKLQSALNKLTDRLAEKVTEAILDSSKLSDRIKCNDPRIKKIKATLESIQQIIQKIQDVLRILQIVVPALTVAAQIASTLASLQLANPVPVISGLVQALAVQNELIATILGALKQASIIVTIVNGSVILASSQLSAVINKLASICDNEIFPVSSATQTAIDSINNEIVDYTPSRFYNVLNTSIDDLDNREELIQQLNAKQLSILDNLIEMPSKVVFVSGTNEPTSEDGNLGDFAINYDTKTFYGPKLSDTEWGMPVKY